jgi:hypothetical protein
LKIKSSKKKNKIKKDLHTQKPNHNIIKVKIDNTKIEKENRKKIKKNIENNYIF